MSVAMHVCHLLQVHPSCVPGIGRYPVPPDWSLSSPASVGPVSARCSVPMSRLLLSCVPLHSCLSDFRIMGSHHCDMLLSVFAWHVMALCVCDGTPSM